MFNKFVQMIVASEGREDAIQNVFYGENGIDRTYQSGKITWEEHQLLLALIGKMA